MFDDDEWQESSEAARARFVWFVMERILLVVGGIVLIVVVSLLCRCCCSGSRGRVIAPPAANISVQAAAPYPRQQYVTPYIAAVPVASAAPTAYLGAPPPAHPAPAASPWAPPYPPAASAPADSCPPSYDQVMAAQFEKQPPYNPNAPH